MKRILQNSIGKTILCLLVALMSGGTSWAQQQDVVYKSIDFANCTRSGYVTENTNTWMATNNDFKVVVSNFRNSNYGSSYLNYISCGRSFYSSAASITTTAAIDKPITKVAVTISQISNTDRISSFTLQTSADYVTWTNAGTFDKSTGTKIVTLSAPTANLYYRIVVNISGGLEFSNNFVHISKVEYYKEPDDPNAVKTPTISGTEWPMFQSQTTITIGCETVGATIWYSKDGGTTWTDYNNTPFTLTESTTIKAKATKDGMTESQVATMSFSLQADVKDVTWDLEKSTHSSSNTNGVTWSTDFAVMTLAKGGSSANANGHLGQTGGTYFYNAQMLKIAPIEGYTIVSIDIIVSGNATDLKSDAWTNATTSASGSTLTVTPGDGTMPVSVVCTAGNSQDFWGNITENYRTIKDVTVHYAPTSLPYIAVENNVLEVTSAETNGTMDLVYNKVTLSEVEVEAHDANGAVTWITPSINGTTGKLEYTIAANTTTSERSAEIWVHCEKAEVTITVTQEAAIVLANADDNTEIIENHDGETCSVVLAGRTLSKNNAWNSLCLPFDLVIEGSILDGDGVIAKELDNASFSANTLTLNFRQVTTLEAGKPYIIKWESGDNLVNPGFGNVTIKSGLTDVEIPITNLDGSGAMSITFRGTYEKLANFDDPRHILYVGSSNNLNYPGPNSWIGAQRAYFKLVGVHAGSGSGANFIKESVIGINDEDPTGIDNVNVNDNLNLNDEPIYNIAGQRISKMQKGINIVNGKKILK